MIQMDIRIVGMESVKRWLEKNRRLLEKNIEKQRHKIGKLIVDRAKDYSPKDTGQLEDAITYRVLSNGDIEIYVPKNSKAGKYAKIMHDTRYTLGRRSITKGSKVGREFIKRAINDQDDKILKELERAFKGIK